MLHYLAYLLVGAFAGIASGLLGIGGGIIVVPALIFLLPLAGVPQDSVVQMAVATSLATVIITSGSSTWLHHRHGSVEWNLLKRSAPLLVAGVIIGAILATYVSGKVLSRIIAVVVIFVAVQLIVKNLQKTPTTEQARGREPLWRFRSLMLIFGALSAMLGVGGGTFIVPYFSSKLTATMQQAVATSSACAVVLGFSATVIYASMGTHLLDRPAESLGYIYLPAFFGIVIASVLFTGLGVRFAQKLPEKQLRYIFAGLMFIVALKMIL